MPRKTLKIVFAVFVAMICITIVVLAITLGMQDGNEAKSSGIVGISMNMGVEFHGEADGI